MLRIIRDLVPVEDADVLVEDDMTEIYDYFIRGNIERDRIYDETRKIDMSYENANIRLRINESSEEDKPIFTLRPVYYTQLRAH